MVNEKIRKAINEYVEDEELEEEETPLILDGATYDNSIIGMSHDGRLVYSYSSMIREFQEENECSYEESREWVDYNTIRALPYAKGKAPIIIFDLVSETNENEQWYRFDN